MSWDKYAYGMSSEAVEWCIKIAKAELRIASEYGSNSVSKTTESCPPAIRAEITGSVE